MMIHQDQFSGGMYRGMSCTMNISRKTRGNKFDFLFYIFYFNIITIKKGYIITIKDYSRYDAWSTVLLNLLAYPPDSSVYNMKRYTVLISVVGTHCLFMHSWWMIVWLSVIHHKFYYLYDLLLMLSLMIVFWLQCYLITIYSIYWGINHLWTLIEQFWRQCLLISWWYQ